MQTKTLSPDERLSWWQLSRTQGIGPITFFRLLDQYGSATKAIEWLPELARRGGRKVPFHAYPRQMAMDELDACQKMGVRVIAACEPDYPYDLRRIDDAPPLICVRGHASLWTKPCVAMVGARNASLAGRKMAHTLARDVGAAGYTIVSGMARGIDTSAHEGALDTGTVAVVAGGVDVIYPPENKALYDRLCDVGAVISEHPLGLEPKAPYFPRRNRIIAGMSLGTCVVEATTGSGSLITAHMAAEQGRDVFAVPGSPMDPRAAGPNSLIRDGAILTERADHILTHLATFTRGSTLTEKEGGDYIPQVTDAAAQLSESEHQEAIGNIMSMMSFAPILVDELARACHLNIRSVQIIVLELELAGEVQRLPGNRIVLIQKEESCDLFSARHR